jgi:hypothetical protein
MSATCRSCPAEIVWLANERTGTPAPIDATPAHNGNVEVDLGAGTYRVLGRQARELALAVGRPLYANHFASCPKRADWKGRRR